MMRLLWLGLMLVALWMPLEIRAAAVLPEQIDQLNQEATQAYYAHDYATAQKKWEQTLNLARQAKDEPAVGIFLGNLGVVYRKLGQYQKALESYQQALAIDRNLGNQYDQGIDLTNIGLVYKNLGQYPNALTHFQQALAIKRELGNRRGEAADLANIGTVYRILAQYQQALTHYQQALAIHRDMNYQRGIGSILTNIGVVYRNLSRYSQALEYYQQALAIHRHLGNQRGECNDLSNIGTVYSHLGDYQKALEYYQQALTIRRDIRDMRGELVDLTNIGVVQVALGQYQTALEYFQQAVAIQRNMGDKHGEGASLTNLSAVYNNLGQYETALMYARQALTIHHEIGDRRNEAADRVNLGFIYKNLGDYSKALTFYQQAVAIQRKIGDQGGVGNSLTNLGELYQKLGNYAKALDLHQQALTLRRYIGDRFGEGEDLTHLGFVYQHMNQLQKAKRAFQDSVAILKALDTYMLWEAQRGLASVEVHLKQFKAAIAHYEQALDNIEKLRTRLTEKTHKLSFMQDKLLVYDEFITLLKTLHEKYPDKGYDRNALEIFERKQGRIFLEEMGKSGARLFAGLPEEISQREYELENQLATTRQQLVAERSKMLTAQNHALIKNLEQRKLELDIQQQALQAKLKQAYPDYYTLKYPQPATLNELQSQVLQPNERMLVYCVMKDNTILWEIGQKTFQMFSLPLKEAVLEKKIAQLREFIGTSDNTRGARIIGRKKRERKPFVQASFDLFTQLLPEKVRPLAPYTVYVVPTGPLYALPFETLVTQAPRDSKDTHYLIEDVPIAYLSSASLLKTLREAQQRRQDMAPYPFLAFANPVYEAEQTAEVFKTSEVLALRSQSYRAIRGSQFNELPETEDEAKEIAALLNAPKDTVSLQLREAASRHTLLKFNELNRLADYQYVLFATHGILPGEVDYITQAALVLSYPNAWGYLTMADVFALQLNAKLVSLSACNTGGGQKMRGEGVMGLTRAFMYAGTPAIAVTLWSVESFSAKTLSVGFFKQIKDLQKPAAALRAIKLRMLHGDEGVKYKRPYYWAPFVVFGDAIWGGENY
ncbi:MAG: hypothetical protein DRR08_05975 [Candidatus Parabeggiatoa sp. nov. 2]|nr:MAG: hypothetical protein B6247_02525 [Beggiatoa sp. 4572_84]RKZ62459.1 MAG: hypothetical protein DRR08_05975 [Gammaproteobacteria bacterium]HEC86037.1 tetratricopeptide repeat protein [Thioploca sp.]